MKNFIRNATLALFLGALGCSSSSATEPTTETYPYSGTLGQNVTVAVELLDGTEHNWSAGEFVEVNWSEGGAFTVNTVTLRPQIEERHITMSELEDRYSATPSVREAVANPQIGESHEEALRRGAANWDIERRVLHRWMTDEIRRRVHEGLTPREAAGQIAIQLNGGASRLVESAALNTSNHSFDSLVQTVTVKWVGYDEEPLDISAEETLQVTDLPSDPYTAEQAEFARRLFERIAFVDQQHPVEIYLSATLVTVHGSVEEGGLR